MDLKAQKEWVQGLGLEPNYQEYALRLFLKLEFCRAEVTHCELRDGRVNVVANGDLLVLGENGRVEWAEGHFNPFLAYDYFAAAFFSGETRPSWWRSFRVADPTSAAQFMGVRFPSTKKGGDAPSGGSCLGADGGPNPAPPGA